MRLCTITSFLPIACWLWFAGTPPDSNFRADPYPLLRAHAHNDYEHRRPLAEALENGFCSVEADVWLVEGKLLVAHQRNQVKPERTLESLYLVPLRNRIRESGGKVYRNGPGFTLLIDIKSEAESTFTRLKQTLDGFREILTRWLPEEKPGAVTVIVSGNRPVKTMAAEIARLAAVDGRLPDLDDPSTAKLIPLVSDNWRNHFTWRGVGPLLENERAKLRNIVKKAHAQKRRVRFWATPESPAIWRELLDAGVDLIGTDDLAALRAFLLQTPSHTAQPVRLCEPSQSGLVVERPHRQRNSLPSSGRGISTPSWSMRRAWPTT